MASQRGDHNQRIWRSVVFASAMLGVPAAGQAGPPAEPPSTSPPPGKPAAAAPGKPATASPGAPGSSAAAAGSGSAAAGSAAATPAGASDPPRSPSPSLPQQAGGTGTLAGTGITGGMGAIGGTGAIGGSALLPGESLIVDRQRKLVRLDEARRRLIEQLDDAAPADLPRIQRAIAVFDEQIGTAVADQVNLRTRGTPRPRTNPGKPVGRGFVLA